MFLVSGTKNPLLNVEPDVTMRLIKVLSQHELWDFKIKAQEQNNNPRSDMHMILNLVATFTFYTSGDWSL